MRTLSLVTTLFILILQTSVSGQIPLKPRDTTIKGPQTFAMIVGISKYRFVRPLNYADKDAELFRDYLKSPGGGSVREDNIFCLLNDRAVNSTFWSKGFQWLKAKQLQKGDRLFIYLAGHGDAIDEDQYFFLTYDCNPGGDKNSYLAGGTIQLFNLKKKIAAETTKGVEVVFIMDACRSNELPGGNEGLNFLNTAVSEKKAGEIMMLATAAGQESLEDISIGNGHGLFTWYLVDGLSGLADVSGGPDYKVTYQEIQTYVDKNVPAIAQQRFKRNQEPYFCCNESSEKIISTVDTAYLLNWLKQTNRSRAGNSFYGTITLNDRFYVADTLLVETYNRFNEAVRKNNITGPSSAEDYYQQLDKKFPGSPYTLDAKTTLAVEYIDAAQNKMNLYFNCADDLSKKEKKRNYQLGANLEKAINLLKDDEPEYAAALMPQMFFWKASGDFGQNGDDGDINTALQYAYQALAVQPKGAFILNRLALLHLQNNNKDSALYYADKATKLAPKWACAFATLTKVQQSNTNNNKPQRNTPGKSSIGFTAGGGLNHSNPTFSGNVNTGFIGVETGRAAVFDAGLIYNVPVGRTVSIRPEVSFSYGTTDITFLSREIVGGAITRETVPVKNGSVTVSLPLVINFSSGKNTSPYLRIGASFSYAFSQDSKSSEILPINKSLALGDAGFGVDFRIPKTGLVISPELKYAAGISELKSSSSTTPYTEALSSLKKQTFSLNVYLRMR